MSADRYLNAHVLLRDGTIYLFEIVREARSADLFGPCRVKLDQSVAAARLGSEVREALQAYGRELSVAEIRAMGNTIAQATGYADAREMNRGLGSASVVYDLEDGEYIYELRAWKTKGTASEPIEETTVQLPRDVSAAALGQEVLRLLEVSQKQNSRTPSTRAAGKKRTASGAKK